MQTLTQFASDTITGLQAHPKFLLPRHFYDDRGSLLFQKITELPEYYLYRAEEAILSAEADKLPQIIGKRPLQIIEPGAGDGQKARYILQAFAKSQKEFCYIPVDISVDTNDRLATSLKQEFPGLSVNPLHGDYFTVLKNLPATEDHERLILFLGSNIGNYSGEETDALLSMLHSLLNASDHLLIGFDLKKSPERILRAYSDGAGITREFNLNHLRRINRELEANFDVDSFEHHASYDPLSGEVKSYLVSTRKQTVHLKRLNTEIVFDAWEPIYMEVSRKYDIPTIESLAHRHGFQCQQHFFARDRDFVDSLWIKVG